jgi:hypothetical protein
VDGVGPRRGRPRKFNVPSRAVTLTLPDHVIEALGGLDTDLSRAVVRLAQPELAKRTHPPAELATFGRRAVIVVNPSRTLEQRAGISLVPLPDGRALISFDQSMSIPALELKVADLVAERRLSAADQAIFEAVGEILRTARRSGDVILQERHIIVIEGSRKSARMASRPRAATPRPRVKRPA